MMKNSSKSDGLRLDGLNIYDYKFREYLCFFDLNASVPDRLRYLALGLQLFRGNGFSQAQYLEFQNHRQLITKLVMGGMIVLLMVIDIVLLCKLLIQPGNDFWYNVYVHALAAAIAIVIFYAVRVWSKTIRANFTHINTALSSQKCLKLMQLGALGDQELFQAIAEGVEDGDIDGVYINDPSVPSLSIVTDKARGTVMAPSSSLGTLIVGDSKVFVSDLAGYVNDGDVNVFGESPASEQFAPSENGVGELPTFRNQLLELSRQKNKFNDLPMIEVVNFFHMMCCPEMEEKVPQMSPEDFLLFLKMGFLGEPSVQGLNFKLAKGKRKYIFAMFYGFLVKSQEEVGEYSNNVRERYAALLFSHFKGFSKENAMNNFSKDQNGWLERTRKENKHKIPVIQELPN